MWEKIAYWLLGLSEAGKEISAKNKAHLQTIHDTTAMMLEMKCAPKEAGDPLDGPESPADAVVMERQIPQAELDAMPAKDFAGKGKSFPIAIPADVAAAAASIGRAGADNYSTDQLKKNIITIARRKGAAFVAKLPKAWRGSEAFNARMLEAWRSYSETTQAVQDAICDAMDCWCYVRDIWDDRVVWCCWEDGEDCLYQASYSITADGAVTLGTPARVRPVTTYEPLPPALMDESGAEPLTGDIVPLSEAAVSTDGAAEIKVIAPGWGSSGYYSPDVLKRDGPAAFPAGTKAYWNHPTPTEEAERPERDLRDLAGVTTGAAAWREDATNGPGLYAPVKVFEGYQASVNDLAPYIGMSIRALGQARAGEAEGRQGPIVERIVKGESIDFVTTPGAGGRIVSLFEAARNRATPTPSPSSQQEETIMTEEEARRLREAYDAMAAENARLREADLLRQVERIVSQTLAASDELLPMTRDRLYKECVKTPPIKDGKLDEAALITRTEDAIRHELSYLAGVVGGGRIVGLGESKPRELTEADVESELASVFGRIGLSESGAKTAARGRAA